MTPMTTNWLVTAAVVLLVAAAVAWLIDRDWYRQHPGTQKRRELWLVRGWPWHGH